MQCMFIWVEKYRNYARQGFNFGGPLRFHYDEELKKLFVYSSPFHIEDFFVPSLSEGKDPPASTVTNVTAIIGENGTGKSSLLEYIIWLLKPETNLEMRKSDHLVVFRTQSDQYVVYHSPALQFELINPLKVEVIKQPLTELDQALLPWTVYFTNIFDARRMPVSQQLIDISTNRLMEIYFAREEQQGIGGYHMEETERQLRFIKNRKNNHADKIPFKLPENITVIVTQEVQVPKIEKKKTAAFSHFGDYIRGCQDELKSYYEDRLINENLLYRVASRVLNHILYEANFIRPKKVLDHLDYAALSANSYMTNSKNNSSIEGHALLSTKLLLLAEYAKKKLNSKEPILRIIYNSHRVLELITKRIESMQEHEHSFELPVTDASETLEKLIFDYHSSVQYDSYLQFKWPGLSSGELALLNLYSRFYRIREFLNKHSKSRSVLVLIDEGEALFHPQWQKQLVSNLVTFLSNVFQDMKIQIVLTSNSPFIASDLPKTNVIFLKNADGKTVSIHELDDQHQTFAANIHTLLAHSFFLQDGLIGTFARKKINEVIDLLVNHGRGEIMMRKQEIEALISIIGEPVIRTKLIQLLQEKMALHGLSLEDRVAALEERLSQLGGGGHL